MTHASLFSGIGGFEIVPQVAYRILSMIAKIETL